MVAWWVGTRLAVLLVLGTTVPSAASTTSGGIHAAAFSSCQVKDQNSIQYKREPNRYKKRGHGRTRFPAEREVDSRGRAARQRRRLPRRTDAASPLPAPHYSASPAVPVALSLRAGAAAAVRTLPNPFQRGEAAGSATPVTAPSASNQAATSALGAVCIAIAISLVYLEHSENIALFVSSLFSWFDVEALKARLLEVLTEVNERGGARGIMLYVSFLAAWEALGLSTIPIETAAGMAFGFRRGLIANASGKVIGAVAAYSAGRLFLVDAVVERLKDSEVFDLVQKSVSRRPYRTALLMRFAPFPELVKNLGLSVLPAVRAGTFAAAAATHAVPFNALWTWLGCDSAARLRASAGDIAVAPNRVLAGLILAVTVFGIVGSPALLGLWVRDRKREHTEEKMEGRGKEKSRWSV